jgi:flagella basal body P-ring formation protein FlgA
MVVKKKSQSRLYLAIALCCGALLASYLMSRAANTQEPYWVVVRPIAAGTQIEAADLGQQFVTLGSVAGKYLPIATNPIGSIARRRMMTGELLLGSSLTDDARALTHQEISVSVRAVDIPVDVATGEIISLYQVHDVREVNSMIAPKFVTGGAFITSIDR